MSRRCSRGLRFALLAAMILLFMAPALAAGATPRGDGSWVSIGVGISPARYGSDRNGSLVAAAAVGRAIDRRKELFARIAYARFEAHEATVLTPLSIGLRLHLSAAPDLEGGPYAEIGPVICRATWRGREAAKSTTLLGGAVGVGTEIKLSSRASVDWGAAIVLTSRARDVWPDRLTRAREREGMERGFMYLALELRP